MKFFVSLLAVCLLAVALPNLVHAAESDPPVLSATVSADGFSVTISGTVADENLSTVELFVNAGLATGQAYSVKPDGTFSIKLDIPPFVEDIVIVVIDEDGQADSLTISL